MTAGRIITMVILVASFVWFLLTAYMCWHGWPRIPLDVSAVDPNTISAHRNAVFTHVAAYAFTGLLPAAIVLIIMWLKSRNA